MNFHRYQLLILREGDLSVFSRKTDNALSSICREFALLFAKKNNLNRELLNFLDRNKGAFNEFQEHLEKGKVLTPQLQQYLKSYQKITIEEGNSIQFIRNLISINKGIEESL